MDNVSNQEIIQLALKFKSTRNNLLFVVIFTAVNLFLFAVEADLSFLFSAFVPQLAFFIVQEESGTAAALAVSFLLTGVYLLLSIMSNQKRGLITVALVLFAIDTAIFLMLATGLGIDFSFIIQIAFYAWILYYLVHGTIACTKLKDVSDEELQEIYTNVAQATAAATGAAQAPPFAEDIKSLEDIIEDTNETESENQYEDSFN